MTASSYIYVMEDVDDLRKERGALLLLDLSGKQKVLDLTEDELLSRGVCLVEKKEVQKKVKKGRLRKIIIRDGKNYKIFFKNEYGHYLKIFSSVSECFVPKNVFSVIIMFEDKRKFLRKRPNEKKIIKRCVIPEGCQGPNNYDFVIQEGKKGKVIRINDLHHALM